MINVYDPDADTRQFLSALSITMCDGYKKRDMKPYQEYKVVLYPCFGRPVMTGTDGGTETIYPNTKYGIWFDMKDINAAHMESTNAQQVKLILKY
ncbi:Hypothetical predicted protein [Mytilus galloprovincialis]|uniref:Uncharacterized protein n=1 Tax=Mytilus galloprovincialis TaxID=29158 RepID=A0A8B6HDJ9_MYTGA|nr:Hypothetical predicted protein [Mytilus galloprovincialis]